MVGFRVHGHICMMCKLVYMNTGIHSLNKWPLSNTHRYFIIIMHISPLLHATMHYHERHISLLLLFLLCIHVLFKVYACFPQPQIVNSGNFCCNAMPYKSIISHILHSLDVRDRRSQHTGIDLPS